ncbi:unnamed protein product [Cuscuta epithymum]|uniref:Uncharacterized protein n=1 Tax=Cuscuta epithymum TaxID=186058 RepID=A0AAV0FZ45_9ASTE|nr:unnamed protein product [Cuscuta epithymum]
MWQWLNPFGNNFASIQIGAHKNNGASYKRWPESLNPSYCMGCTMDLRTYLGRNGLALLCFALGVCLTASVGLRGEASNLVSPNGISSVGWVEGIVFLGPG